MAWSKGKALDPNEAYNAIREAMNSALRSMAEDTDHPSFCVVDNHTVSELVGAFQNLDEWLSKGGFLPTVWER